MPRFAAKLLFQFRVNVNRDPGKRRTCEERIVNLEASSARIALRQVQRRGHSQENKYTNSDGNTVYFEFIGVMDLLELGLEAAHDEVWYDIYERIEPMERRKRFIPSDETLLAQLSRNEN